MVELPLPSAAMAPPLLVRLAVVRATLPLLTRLPVLLLRLADARVTSELETILPCAELSKLPTAVIAVAPPDWINPA